MADRTDACEGAVGVAIVAMRERHLGGVVDIEAVSNPRPWSHDLFASELKQVSSRCFVAVQPSNEVVGFACLMSTGFEAHITNIATLPRLRRSGIATALMLHVFREAIGWGLESITLEVRASNLAAQRLYERFGFVADGVRPKYYVESNEDAIIMWAHDISSAESQERLAGISAGMTRR
ncbi:MAG: ribosomal protein S18-alanine N-acetyltransferase [Actinobacteria bacterium]|nr:ribosomal protein S18-alanine N-acetyltransferase [Actinomycetota bacterium]